MLISEAVGAKQQMTVDEFERLLAAPENSDRLLKLVEGEVAEKIPSEEHGLATLTLGAALLLFVKKHKLERVGTEVRHRLPDDSLNSRLPDISFTSARRPLVREGSVPEMPDLAVEIKSPSDTVRKLRDKAAYYLENGVRLVWLVFPEQRIVEVYTPDGEVEILVEGDLLDGGEVLPGFSFPVAEIFADPLAG